MTWLGHELQQLVLHNIMSLRCGGKGSRDAP
jgi:hypothetical protein